MNYVIRRVKPYERDALNALYSHLYPQDIQIAEEDLVQETWKAIISDEKLYCFVVDYSGELIGTCILIVVPNLTRGARPYGFIENVVVHSEYRSKGIGSELINVALQTAWEKNCYKVMLLSASHNLSAHRFFEMIGFSRKSKTGFEIRAPV